MDSGKGGEIKYPVCLICCLAARFALDCWDEGSGSWADFLLDRGGIILICDRDE